MPYQNYRDGLYLVRKRSTDKSVDHYGVLDIGNRTQLLEVDQGHPVVIHQTPPAIRIDWLAKTGQWQAITRILDEPAAVARMYQALQNPAYDLFGHNCEQFARYVALGTWESTQLQVAVVAGITAVAVLSFSVNDRGRTVRRSAALRRRRVSRYRHGNL